jgi:hypothetical protein
LQTRFQHYLTPTRLIAATLLLTFSSACTHTAGGEKAFKSFDQCVASNLALAGVGGIGLGVFAAGLTAKLTGDRTAARKAGTAVGVGSAIAVGFIAWRKCAAVYSTSVVIEPAPTTPATNSGPRNARLNLDTLQVSVTGSENDAPQPDFALTYLAKDPNEKDIKLRLRHKVETVRFKAGDDGALFLVNGSNNFLMDSQNKPVPLEKSNTIPRERLAWIAIALEGQEDYVEDIVVQQGPSARFRHQLQMPNREQLPVPLPLPMRYTLTVEAAEMRDVKTVDFAVLPSAERPKIYQPIGAAQSASKQVPRPAAAATPVVAAAPQDAPKVSQSIEQQSGFKLKRTNTVYSDTSSKRRPVGRVLANTLVTIEETSEVVTAGRTSAWVKINAQNGPSGWLLKSELGEVK